MYICCTEFTELPPK